MGPGHDGSLAKTGLLFLQGAAMILAWLVDSTVASVHLPACRGDLGPEGRTKSKTSVSPRFSL